MNIVKFSGIHFKSTNLRTHHATEKCGFSADPHKMLMSVLGTETLGWGTAIYIQKEDDEKDEKHHQQKEQL